MPSLNRASILLSNRMQSFSVTVLDHFCFLWISEKIPIFPLQETPTLTLTFHQNGCTIRDPNSRKKVMVSVGVSWNGKSGIFSLIHRKQKWTRTVTLIYWRLPYCLNVVDYPGIDFVFMQDSAPSYHAKAMQHVSTTEHSRLHSCCWKDIIFCRSYF